MAEGKVAETAAQVKERRALVRDRQQAARQRRHDGSVIPSRWREPPFPVRLTRSQQKILIARRRKEGGTFHHLMCRRPQARPWNYSPCYTREMVRHFPYHRPPHVGTKACCYEALLALFTGEVVADPAPVSPIWHDESVDESADDLTDDESADEPVEPAPVPDEIADGPREQQNLDGERLSQEAVERSRRILARVQRITKNVGRG
jgi:hypothetical protein